MENNCKFCGQGIILNSKNMEGKDPAEAATMLCKCEEGEDYRSRATTLEHAKEVSTADFKDCPQSVQTLIYQMSEMAYDEEIRKGELQLNSISSVSIKKVTVKGKNTLRIERVDREVTSHEV